MATQSIDMTQVNSVTFNNNAVTEIYLNSVKIWPGEENCLTFSSPSSFTLGMADNTAYWDGTIEYSTDKFSWTEWDGTSSISSANKNGNNVLYLKGSENTYITGSNATDTSGYFVLTGSNISCSGEIETLLDYETVAAGNHPAMGSSAFARLFYNNFSLIQCPNLSSTTLGASAYYYMFSGCSSITATPTLPATTLAASCYGFMFQGCTSLTTPPTLSSTSLANYCYYSMFRDCTGLTSTPALPATTLASWCYGYMFMGCTSLISGPVLPSTGTAYSYCYAHMFQGCTSLTGVPAIKTKVFESQACREMFRGCTSISGAAQNKEYRIPINGGGSLASGATDVFYYMFYGIASNYKLPVTPTLNSYNYLHSSNTVIK